MNLGEKIAAKYLGKKGYRIVDANWYCRWGEIDLVCEKDGELVFVEVKMRNEADLVDTVASINWKKARSLRRAIRYYLKCHSGWGRFRMDVIAVTTRNQGSELAVFHYPSALPM